MTKLYVFFLLINLCIPGLGLIIQAPELLTRLHTKARFGYDYRNTTIVGPVKVVQPFNACSDIETDLKGWIGLAIRGGPSSCSFATKVKMVMTT